MKRICNKAFFVLMSFVLCGVIFSCNFNDFSTSAHELTIEEDTDFTGNISETAETEKETICIYICGYVKSPGIYYLNSEARLYEALDKAGGFSDGASDETLNLAEILVDGMRIYIPSKEEVSENPDKLLNTDTDSLININTASAEELKTLSGIGDTKADAIINYRESEGAFKAIEDIMNVSGIGKASFEKIKNNIKV